MKPVDDITPKAFRELRDQAGAKQMDVARDMGVSQAALSRWEHGGGRLAEWRILRAADRLMEKVTP